MCEVVLKHKVAEELHVAESEMEEGGIGDICYDDDDG